MGVKWVSNLFALIVLLTAGMTASADIKMKTRNTLAGTSTEGSIYIKGKRQRSTQNFGGIEMATITQCDLNRTVQINDRARTYMVTPMNNSDSAAPARGDRQPAARTQPTTTRRGGVLTYTTTITDTGERKKMFGFVARHIKTSMTVESSPDACNPSRLRTESDGWYIDLEFNFNCDSDKPHMPSMPQRSKPECQDEIRFKTSGSAKLGYPVMVTTIIYLENGQTSTTTTEVVELTTTPLDEALFEIPTGYTEAKTYQELMGMPSIDAMIKNAGRGVQPSMEAAAHVAAGAKQPGTIRVGVVAVTNKTDRAPSLSQLRARLIGGISESDVDAVPLDSTSPSDIEAEAKQKDCDYILYTDIAQLKTSGKVGGLLGRATGVGSLKEKVESRLDFKLYPVGSSAPRLSSSASAKEEGAEDVSLSAAAGQEAKAVLAEVRKKK